MNKQLRTDLLALKELFSVPSRWTQRATARDADGVNLRVDGEKSPYAVCFCLVGGVRKVVGDQMRADQMFRLFMTLIPGDMTLPTFNDTHTYNEVIDLIERGVQAVENGVGAVHET